MRAAPGLAWVGFSKFCGLLAACGDHWGPLGWRPGRCHRPTAGRDRPARLSRTATRRTLAPRAAAARRRRTRKHCPWSGSFRSRYAGRHRTEADGGRLQSRHDPHRGWYCRPRTLRRVTNRELGRAGLGRGRAADRAGRDCSEGVSDQESLATRDLLAGVEASGCGGCGVSGADGMRVDQTGVRLGKPPSASRTLSRSASRTRSTVPSSSHQVQDQYIVGQGGKFFVSCRQAHPVRTT